MTIKIRAEKKEDFEFISDFVEEVFKGTDYSDGLLERKIVSGIPADALMAMELYEGGLHSIEGEVSFSIYKCLS